MAFENLTKFPRGLIGTLGLRDNGQNPRTLLGELRGGIDLRDFYLLNEREQLAFSLLAPALGSNLLPEAVPANELWYVWAFTNSITVAAATAITLRPVVSFESNSYFHTCDDVGYVAGAAGEQLRVGTNRPFIASPGSVFGFHVRSITGAPGNVDSRAVITRLRI